MALRATSTVGEGVIYSNEGGFGKPHNQDIGFALIMLWLPSEEAPPGRSSSYDSEMTVSPRMPSKCDLLWVTRGMLCTIAVAAIHASADSMGLPNLTASVAILAQTEQRLSSECTITYD